jgi:hypothetical protein
MNDSQDALEQACATVGIDAGGARLLRVGSNAVYRLKPPIIVRVSRPGADPGQVRRTVAVARWLESAGYPAVRAVDVDQPVAVDGHLVTFWEAVSDDGDQYASTAEVAELLAKLHALTAPDDLHLPELAPFANAPQRIQANTWLNPEDRAFLTNAGLGCEPPMPGLSSPCRPVSSTATRTSVTCRDRYGNPVDRPDGFASARTGLALTAVYDSFGALPARSTKISSACMASTSWTGPATRS